MAVASVYLVTTTLGVQYRVSRSEYEYLIELGLLASLDEVIVPVDQVLIGTSYPLSPAIGQVFFNTSIP